MQEPVEHEIGLLAELHDRAVHQLQPQPGAGAGTDAITLEELGADGQRSRLGLPVAGHEASAHDLSHGADRPGTLRERGRRGEQREHQRHEDDAASIQVRHGFASQARDAQAKALME